MENPFKFGTIVEAFFVLLLWLSFVPMTAQPLCHVTYYDEEDGLPHGHVTQLLQDEQGFMWFATWNGLCRYDGYEFRTFKPQAGGGCQMTTDRIRTFVQRPDGNIVCRVDEDYFLFDIHNYQFSNMAVDEAEADLKNYHKSLLLKNDKTITWKDAFHTQWTLSANGQLTYRCQDGQAGDYPLDIKLKDLSFACTDRQGNLWVLDNYNGVYKLCTDMQHTHRLAIEPQAQVKCLFTDRQNRCWVTTKEDGAVRVYRDGSHLLGYLGSDGRLHQQYTRFGASVYSIYQMSDGTLWFGTKPDGLFRLREMAVGTFQITHMTNLPNNNIYNMVDDGQGRLWVATLGGGLCYTDQPQVDQPRFMVPKNYPKDVAQKVRYLLLLEDEQVLMAATTEGLIVTKLERNPDQMHFRLHQREADRAQSLSSSATMDIMKSLDGHLYVSTESGGVNRIDGGNLLSDKLTFSHFTARNHLLPTDVVLSMTSMEQNKMMVVSGHLVSLVDRTGHYRQLDSRYLGADYRFSDAHPQPLADGRWLFGLTDGALVTRISQKVGQTYLPKVVLTGVSIQGGDDVWAIARADTLMLQPNERNITLHFSAIDYQAADCISYAFRLQKEGRRDTTQWNYIGHDRSVTLLDLEPGTYLMAVRSTNADGEWLQNQRLLTIVVKPTFWESALGRLLLALLIVCIISAVVYTLLYIRRIKRQQHETLEKYLALIEVRDEKSWSHSPVEVNRDINGSATSQDISHKPPLAPELDPILQRVMQFVEENIDNSEVNIGDMASAAAISRSGLQRKLKQAMGITPQDLLREARIKRACQLLRQTDKTVSEVAYSCGFSDPKYFSRCFKQTMNLSPTEYKAQS